MFADIETSKDTMAQFTAHIQDNQKKNLKTSLDREIEFSAQVLAAVCSSEFL
jgi:hypothetical protein